MLFGRTGNDGKLFTLPSYSTKELVIDSDTVYDMEQISSAMLGRKVGYHEFINNTRYNNIEPILNEYFFESSYGSFSSLNDFVRSGDVKVIGHFDKIGVTKDPNCYAFKDKRPVCDFLMWFTNEGYKEQSTTQPWSCTYRLTEKSAQVKKFCEETPFTVYLVNPEDEDKKMVLMLYDKMFEIPKASGVMSEWYSLALGTQRTGVGISWASALSCVTPTFEDA